MSIHSTLSMCSAYSTHSVHSAYSTSLREDAERNAEAEKILYSDDGIARYRRPLRLPPPETIPAELKAELAAMSYAQLMETPLGRYHYLVFLQHVVPSQGRYLLMSVIYKTCRECERPAVAQALCEMFMPAVHAIHSVSDLPSGLPQSPSTRLEAALGRGLEQSGKRRRGSSAQKVLEAKALLCDVRERLQRRGALLELFDPLNVIVASTAACLLKRFRRSAHFVNWAQAVSLETAPVSDADFFHFRVLGVGGFGEVSAAIKRDTGAVYAVKRMSKKLIKHKNRYKSCEMEVACLKSVRSRFICGLHYTFQSEAEVCLVLDMLHGGTLSYLLQQRKRVSERLVRFFAACIVLGYEALHKAKFVYRDMKPANVLLNSLGYCCLIDFGLAAKVEHRALSGKCGTRGYWAPEMVKGDQYTFSSDWWALGVTLLELLTGRKPFKRKLQRCRNTEDKMRIVKAGSVDDVIEEASISDRLARADNLEDDQRDSADDESEEEDDELTGLGSSMTTATSVTTATASRSRRRSSSVRLIGHFDKAIRSQLDSKTATSLLEACIKRSLRLAPLSSTLTANAAQRLVRLLSVLHVAPREVIFEKGAHATFLLLLLSGELLGGSDKPCWYESGAILGDDALTGSSTKRVETVAAGERGATVGLLLFSEIPRAELFDAPIIAELRKVLARGGASLPVGGGGSLSGEGGVRLATPSPRLEGLREAEIGDLPCVDELRLADAGGGLSDSRAGDAKWGGAEHRGGGEKAAEEAVARAREDEAIACLVEPESFVVRHAQLGSLGGGGGSRQQREQLSQHRERDLKIYLTQEVWVRKDSMSSECADLLQGLLTRDTNQRLGCGEGGCEALKAHPFFDPIDWDSLSEGRMAAPYLPKRTVNAKGEAELKHFNTKGMKELSAEEQKRWESWPWTSARNFQYELAAHLYESWLREDRKHQGKGALLGRARACCAIM